MCKIFFKSGSMKKVLFVLFSLITLLSKATVINVTPVGAGVDMASNINTAIASATSSVFFIDTIKFPSGSYRVDGTISITKKVCMVGAGIDTTILYRDESISDATLTGWGPMFNFIINSNRNSRIVIWRITFKGQVPNITTGDGGSLASDIGVKINNAVDFIIHDCKFMYFGDSGLQIRHRDYLARGLIYKSQFYRNSKGYLGLGLGYGIVIYGEGLRWIDNIQLGDENAIYVEDCQFDYNRHDIASAGGALVVGRYCKFRNHIAVRSAHSWDTHQDRGPGNSTNTFGTRRYECYGNSFINTTQYDGVTPVASPVCEDSIQERAIGITNGDGVVFNDTVIGYRFGLGVIQSENTSGPYPWYGQPGYKSGLSKGASHTGTDARSGEGDLYYWNLQVTTYTTTCGGPSTAFINYDAVANGGTGVYIVADRDYHANVQKPGYKPFPYPYPKRAKIKWY
jgi:hypothetical protein